MGESQPDAESSKKPSRPPFDPVAGVRAMADIQAEGLRAAGDLIERMLGSEPDGPGPRESSAPGDYAVLVDAWTDLLRRTVDGLARLGRPGAVTVAVDSNRIGPQVRLALRESGNEDASVAEVWLHTERPAPWARLPCAADSSATPKAPCSRMPRSASSRPR
jgi:hypothetical protein